MAPRKKLQLESTDAVGSINDKDSERVSVDVNEGALATLCLNASVDRLDGLYLALKAKTVELKKTAGVKAFDPVEPTGTLPSIFDLLAWLDSIQSAEHDQYKLVVAAYKTVALRLPETTKTKLDATLEG